MNDYETEEQQIEALKKWWKENGTSLIVGLFIGVSALFGWRYYDEQQNVHALEASDLYMEVVRNAADDSQEKLVDLSNRLVNDYADTPYAALVSLLLAKVEYEKNNVDATISQLEIALKTANDDTLKQLANLRLASVLIEQGKLTEASEHLNMEHASVYDAQYAELKGDLYVADGEIEKARTAYDEAINLLGRTANKWLKLKRQNLGSV